MTEAGRDARDLRILSLIEEGLTQEQICQRMGCSRGLITRLLGDIRKDEQSEGRS